MIDPTVDSASIRDAIKTSRRPRTVAVDPRAFAGPLTRDPNLDDTMWQAYIDETRMSLRTIAEDTGGFAVLDADLEEGLEKIDAAVRR